MHSRDGLSRPSLNSLHQLRPISLAGDAASWRMSPGYPSAQWLSKFYTQNEPLECSTTVKHSGSGGGGRV